MIRTIRPVDRPDPGLERVVAKSTGFSLFTGVRCEVYKKRKNASDGPGTLLAPP